MVKKNPFTKEQGAYLYYIQRWKATGEGLEPPCQPWCRVHRGAEPTKRLRFGDFCEPLRKLAEVEFYLIALKNEGKTRGGHYPKLVKEARDLRALLLIEEDKKEEGEEAQEVEDADDKPTPALLEEAIEIEGKLANKREKRRQPDLTKPEKEGGEGTVTV